MILTPTPQRVTNAVLRKELHLDTSPKSQLQLIKTQHTTFATNVLLSRLTFGSEVFIAQWCLTLQPHATGSSVHRIPQARILEWVAIPFSTGSLVVNFSSNLPLSIPSIPSSKNLGSIKTHFHYILDSYHFSPHSNIVRYYIPTRFQFLVFPSFNLSSRFTHHTWPCIGRIACLLP